MNLIQIQKKYGNNEKCRAYLEKLRWGKTVKCTKCNSTNVVKLKKQVGRYHCNVCKTTFSVISDTIFEESRLPLPTWFNGVIAYADDMKQSEPKDEIIPLPYIGRTERYGGMKRSGERDANVSTDTEL